MKRLSLAPFFQTVQLKIIEGNNKYTTVKEVLFRGSKEIIL